LWHLALSDFLGNLRTRFGHYRLGSSLHLVLDNPKNSSQILECPAKPSVESRTDSESMESLDSKIQNLLKAWILDSEV